ncbi:MAG: helix-turn-helix domain-containing protein [Anaerolineales bacterium]|nr:helix-turn-helix domain-containing protein [Anaerolineales bacterium]
MIAHVAQPIDRADAVLSTREAAARCRVSTETIRRWIRYKGLPAYNTELGLKIRIRAVDLEAFAARHNILLVESQAVPVG